MPDPRNPTVDDAADHVVHQVEPSVYDALRRRDAPVLRHATYSEGWRAATFHGGRGVVLMSGGH